MAYERKDTAPIVEKYMTMEVGETQEYPLSWWNTVRGIKSQNPKVLMARSKGNEFSIKMDLPNAVVILTRTA
ncbi:MAG: hypothetical protein LUD17_05050 [Bacteroidales bacterium]|nr:hypothetical protein [Bacteroidales bacterium]